MTETILHQRANRRVASDVMVARRALRRAVLGGETGFSFPVYVKSRSFVSVHPSIGIARRIDGTGTSADRTTFTWNIGAVLMLPKF
jgi:hypothetical protein